jgi:RNA polymerase sigma-70 factor (ECF subfamily)
VELTRDEVFQQHRGLVFTIAYDITGSVADAEDVAQETYLRWLAADADIREPRAYLAKIAGNQARNALRASERRREDYVGPWLPEPLVTGTRRTDELPADPEHAAMTAEAVSTAMLVVLQSLTDDERAGFILREVFDFRYADVAEALGRSEAATRQLVHRAKSRVRERPVRNDVGSDEHRRVVEGFLRSAATGDIQSLLHLLAPDVVLLSDGGGRATSALRPIVGAEKTLRFVLGLAEKYGATSVPTLAELNGALGVLFSEHGEVTTVFQFEIARGLVQRIFVVRNPDKLSHLD